MENKKPDCVIKEITGEDVLRYFHWIKGNKLFRHNTRSMFG
jgi:hypothetical protein